MISPYVNTHRDITYSYEPMSLHSHPFYEIICCRSTCGAEYLIGPYRYSLQKGDILLVRPGTSHCVILPEHLSIPYERDVLWINVGCLYQLLEILGIAPNGEMSTFLLRTAGTPWEYLCSMIHRGVLEEENKQEAWELDVIGNTIQVISHMYRATVSKTAQPIASETADLLDDMIAYIDGNYPHKLTLTSLGKHFYVSERTISTLFRQRLGTTFGDFLTQRRLIAAKTHIVEGLSLEAAAEQAGFSNYSTFYRAFRQEYGISPRTFKHNAL